MTLNSFLQSKKITHLEGHVQGSSGKIETLKQLVNTPGVVEVMEIGFNAGHSAEIFLSSNPNIKLTSFDIGHHTYLLQGKQYIDTTFPNRHQLVIGDSLLSVPNYIRDHPEKKFDLILIDGGHTYEIAKGDLYNCKSLAHENTIVVMDDTMFTEGWSHEYNIGPSKIWSESIDNKFITEINRIDYSSGMGLSWAKYNF